MRFWISLGILLITFVVVCANYSTGREDGMLYVLVTSSGQLFNGEAELYAHNGQRTSIAPIQNGQVGFAFIPHGNYTLKVRESGPGTPFLAELDLQIKSSASDVYYEMEIDAPVGPG